MPRRVAPQACARARRGRCCSGWRRIS